MTVGQITGKVETGRLGVSRVGRSWRWFVAAGVVVAAFAVPAVACGLWVLPSLIEEAGTRWAVASALGAALATLAVLWGQSFTAAPSTPTPATVVASGTRSVAVKGPVKGNITTGDQGTAAPSTAGRTPADPGALTVPGAVTAPGERAVALSDGFEGDITTGNQGGGSLS